MRFSSIRYFVSLVTLSSIFALSAGCTAGVEVGEKSTDGKQSITSSKAASNEAIALLYSQFPDSGGGGVGGNSTSSGGGGDWSPDPDTLYVMVGSYAIACAEPHAYSGCDSWHVSIGIPPKLQVPGVLSLEDPALISYQSVNDELEPNATECGGGGGSFIEGTIEILSIDEKEVVFELAGTDTLFGFKADGVYTASRCP